MNLPLLIVGPRDGDPFTLGAHAQYVPGCREAERFLQRHVVPVVICERDLPDGNWRNVLGSFTAMADPPLLIVTSRVADDDLWLEVLNAGGYNVMAKPWDEMETRRTIAQAQQKWSEVARGKEHTNMFGSLNEEIRRREPAESTLTRWLRHVVVFVASLFAFGALYAGIMLLD